MGFEVLLRGCDREGQPVQPELLFAPQLNPDVTELDSLTHHLHFNNARKRLPQDTWLFLNVAPSTFIQVGYEQTLANMARAAGLDPGSVVLEILESEGVSVEELALAARDLAGRFGADFNCIVGDDLTEKNFPLIHAVGMASSRAPRLIDLTWGNPAHPKVTLVGKGVCFDTGGLDLKPSVGMLIMKKDMGGAANVLALAQMVMDAGLKLRLRVLIPAVENAVAGNAFRPLDIFRSRKGLTVEIGNTDAEGRLVLADALALACEDKPDLLIDMGTLTGAARVALGPDLPPFYTNDETLALDVARCAREENDPLWRLPLWPPYDSWLDSKVANVNNAPSGTFAGSITCALFLQRFVDEAISWLHVDIYGWTPSAKPARPEGGECQAARAIYKLLGERYG